MLPRSCWGRPRCCRYWPAPSLNAHVAGRFLVAVGVAGRARLHEAAGDGELVEGIGQRRAGRLGGERVVEGDHAPLAGRDVPPNILDDVLAAAGDIGSPVVFGDIPVQDPVAVMVSSWPLTERGLPERPQILVVVVAGVQHLVFHVGRNAFPPQGILVGRGIAVAVLNGVHVFMGRGHLETGEAAQTIGCIVVIEHHAGG